MKLFRVLTILVNIFVVLSAQAFTPQALWTAWPDSRLVTTAAPCLSHAQLIQRMELLQTWYPEKVELEEVGYSRLGKSIRMLSVGHGERKILLWSQMHGDEPSATPALLDIANYLMEHAGDAAVQSILDSFTLLMIPMLNPDGTGVYERFNAQGIDINRDALHLATPEGRLLKKVRDQHTPMMGFNLHDQNRRTAVGDSGQLASMAVLSVSGDAANTLTPGRELTRKAAAAVVQAVLPFRPGGVARYDEGWSPTAFGDNLTAWGTPVLLIESGGVPPGTPFTDLTRLNFVAVLSVLQHMAEDNLSSVDPRIYEDLLRNRSRVWSDVAFRGGYILLPGIQQPYRADLLFDVLRSDQQLAGCAQGEGASSAIAMVGDSTHQGAGTIIDARNTLIVTPFEVGIRGWKHSKWMSKPNLLRLTQLGVGRLYWAIGKDRQNQAREFVRSLETAGRLSIEVIDSRAELPPAVLSGPPPASRPDSLSGVLEVLGIGTSDAGTDLQKMWLTNAADVSASALLRKNRAASFLLIGPVRNGQVDYEFSRLQSVWLDGVEINAK